MDSQSIGALLVLAGNRPQGYAKTILKQLAGKLPHPLIVAADGGALYLAELGITPDLIIGDGDSLDKDIFPRTSRKIYPKEKDFTDGEAAFRYLFEESFGDIAVFAAFGGEIDHFFANILLPLAWGEKAERFIYFGENSVAKYCSGFTMIEGKPGEKLSIIPVSGGVKGISLSGMTYPLNDFDLELGSSRCLRNTLTGPMATIKIKEGIALIIHYKAST